MTNKIMIFHVLPDSIIHVIIKQYLTLEEIYTCTTHQSLISKYFYHLCRSLVQREKKESDLSIFVVKSDIRVQNRSDGNGILQIAIFERNVQRLLVLLSFEFST